MTYTKQSMIPLYVCSPWAFCSVCNLVFTTVGIDTKYHMSLNWNSWRYSP